VNSLVREAIIQDRAEDVFEKDGYAIKFKFVNDLELIFVVCVSSLVFPLPAHILQVAYQRILQLTYVDDLLNVIRNVFVDMFAPFLKNFLAAVHASTSATAAGIGSLVPQWDFKAQLREWDATFDKILRSLQDKAAQVRSFVRFLALSSPTSRRENRD
jgi:signal recognition particle receptor subunit alpha